MSVSLKLSLGVMVAVLAWFALVLLTGADKVFGLAVSIVLGTAAYLFIDRPLNRLLRRFRPFDPPRGQA